jgi:cobaltochelatase CobN
MAVTIGHLPPLLVDAGLPDDLLNLESTLNKYDALAPGALRREFAGVILTQARAAGLVEELGLAGAAHGRLTDAEVERLAAYLHDLGNEQIPATMHVLGVPPPDELRLPYLVRAMGQQYLAASRALYGNEPTDELLLAKAREVLTGLLRRGLTPAEAVRQSGGKLPAGELPAAVREGLSLATQMDAGFSRAPEEITALLAALEGRFLSPGPAGAPERNPAVVPGGRNLVVENPTELPTRASWELGTRLLRDYLAAELRRRGHYPEKIAFSLIPYATFGDYGVVESQILYLLGVRPVWDEKERVTGVELIPAAELGRPRIDVFLSARSVYRDELPSMMRLLDRAIRLVATLPEKGNRVYQHTLTTRRRLEKKGVPAARAQTLAQARMFGAEPEELVDSHNWFFYLTERSGEWETREELLDVYLRYCKHAYTDGAWGEQAPEAFDAAIEDTELILRSWYDNRDFVLSNKFAWWVDGTLSLTVERLTGKTPELLFVDVRNTDDAALVDSTTAVQQDLRARLTNPRWIRGMMQEGYAGGNAVAKTIDNLMGWEITRETSVADHDWNELVDVYVRDQGQLGVRAWLEGSNPHALQKVAVTLLETSRKGFWQADPGTREELARVYAESVVRHGPVEGIRAGGNEKLRAYVDGILAAPARPELAALRQRFAETSASAPGPTPEAVRGQRLEKVSGKSPAAQAPGPQPLAVVAGIALLLVAAGFFARDVHGRRQESRGHG